MQKFIYVIAAVVAAGIAYVIATRSESTDIPRCGAIDNRDRGRRGCLDRSGHCWDCRPP